MSRLRFVGKDPLLKTGKIYNVEIEATRPKGMFDRRRMLIVDIEKFGICPYDSLEAFMNNWELPYEQTREKSKKRKRKE